MSRHLILLPAPEAEWAQLPAEEHEKGMRSHQQFIGVCSAPKLPRRPATPSPAP